MTIAEEIDDDVIDGVYYPSSDGEPVAEIGVHLLAMFSLFPQLKKLFADRSDVYIACDMLWYREQGNPKACIAPDIMVNPGVPPGDERRSSKSSTENGVVPSVTFEMMSRGTWRRNMTVTKDRYESLGVKEYYMFDPLGQYLKEQVVGFKLVKGRYRPALPDEDGAIPGPSMGCRLVARGRLLRLVDAATGEVIPTEKELNERAFAEAASEKQRADQQAARAASEKQRADELQQELERLRAQLAGRLNGRIGGHSK